MDKNEMSTELYPDGLLRLLLQANDLRLKAQWADALAVYRQVSDECGEDAQLLAAMASCIYVMWVTGTATTSANAEEAVSLMTRAVAAAPQDAELHVALAEYLEMLVLDYERAEQECRRALDLNPHLVNAMLGLARLYGPPESPVTLTEAIEWLERAIQLRGTEPWLHVLLGQLYDEAERPLEARRAWARALLCKRPLEEEMVRSLRKQLSNT
jgi:Flp pilus assembly protein TadD